MTLESDLDPLPVAVASDAHLEADGIDALEHAMPPVEAPFDTQAEHLDEAYEALDDLDVDALMDDAPSTTTAAVIRRTPQNIQSEESILGGLLSDNSAIDSVMGKLRASDFYLTRHQRIYEEILFFNQSGRACDPVTIYESLKDRGLAQEVGGAAYLQGLAEANPSTANIHQHIELVRGASIRRQLIGIGETIVDTAENPEGREVRDLVNAAESDIMSLSVSNSRVSRGFQSMTTLVRAVTGQLIEMSQQTLRHGAAITGVPTGYPNLDKETVGFQRGDLIILAGRPSMGKTSLAINIAENILMTQNLPVLVFSMEMGGDQLAQRMLSSIARVDAQKLRTGNLSNEEWARLTEATERMEKWPLYIDDSDSTGMTINELCSRARRQASQLSTLGLIVVDYLQLMGGGSRKQESRSQELSEVSRGLKTLARELNVPVLALSQLNRSVDSRKDRRPLMSDLRESGAIEQDADVIMFIYRDVVYNKATPDPNLAELIVAKQRNGPVGTLRMTFLGGHTRFEATADEGYWDLGQ